MQVNQLIEAMMPGGSQGDEQADWSRCPQWPPDVFAIAATLVDRSAAYTRLYSDFDRVMDPDNKDLQIRIASAWSNDSWLQQGSYPVEKNALQKLWDVLVNSRELIYSLEKSESTDETWISSSLTLMIIADSACTFTGVRSYILQVWPLLLESSYWV